MKATRVKKAVVSDVGKMIANSKDEFELAFDKIKDLIFVATSLKPFKQETGLLVYQKLVLGTRRQKDPEDKRIQIAGHVRPYRKMFEAYRDRIVQEDLTWITESEIDLVTGNSKTAKLPLSKVYEFCLKNDESSLGTLEANLYYIFMHLTNKDTESVERKKLIDICDQYQLEEDQSTEKTVSAIVDRVKRTMPTGGDDKPPSMNDISAIVQGLVGDGGMGNDMGGLANGLLSGQLTIPMLIENVKRAVEGSTQSSEQPSEVTAETPAEEDQDATE